MESYLMSRLRSLPNLAYPNPWTPKTPKGKDIITAKSEFPSTDSFVHFYFNDCSALSDLITCDIIDQFDQTLWIWGQESDLSN